MKLTLDRIVEAGMATFAEVGYSGLSMRQVADRLGVQVGSLYYHVKNKDGLLHLMADQVARQAYDAGTEALDALPADADWPTRVRAQADALRRSIRAHPGGAVLLADSPKVLSDSALALMERLLGTLGAAGVPVEHRSVAADTVLSYITGFVVQEQSDSQAPPVTEVDYASMRQRFPLLMTERPDYDVDEIFRRSVDLLCAGIAGHIPAE